MLLFASLRYHETIMSLQVARKTNPPRAKRQLARTGATPQNSFRWGPVASAIHIAAVQQ
jgi:hypothetical protein